MQNNISPLQKAGCFLIVCYQKFISPVTGNQCRFYPTCSNYAYEAIDKYGFIKGWYLAIKRILRCNPFGNSGYDPVPQKK